jgi:hypothetical protein
MGLVKAFHVLIPRCFGKLAIETIGPAMVLTGKNLRVALFLSDNWEGSVSANVVETFDISLSVSTEEELEAGFLESYPVTGVGESQPVRDENPSPGEYRPPLKLIEFLRFVPCRW